MAIETRRGEPTPPIEFEPGSVAGQRPSHLTAPPVEVSDALIARLRAATTVVQGDEALDEAGRDWWPLTLGWSLAGEVPARPAVIARPADAGQVADVMRICNEARVPLTPAAGRSGVCGASIPVFGGVALDMTAMAGIVEVDEDSLLVSVLPGTFGDVFEDDLRASHQLTLGHWPQSMQLSTVGGWLACRSAGQYSTRYGKIEDMVVGLDVVLADGTAVTTGGLAPHRAVGPDLTGLFVGSEGTLGVITRATLRAHPQPPASRRCAWGFSSFRDGLDACRRILRRGATPAVLRLYDRTESVRTFKEETNALVVLDEGDHGLVDFTIGVVDDECRANAVALDESHVGRWLEHRNDVSALPSLVARGIVLDTIEVAARWSVLPRLYDEAVGALMAIDGMMAASAHQSHAYGDGACLYFTWAARMPEGTPIGGAAQEGLYRQAWDAVTGATLEAGGALSHHHGIGLNRSRFVPTALGDGGMAVLRGLKDTLDPNGILNPGKLGLASPWGPAPGDWAPSQ
ncbi:MAG: FAD-binding oxidoreductase [Acidimicrobiales bacterium]